MSKYTAQDKLQEVEREIKMRIQLYDRRVSQASMTPADALRKIEIMKAIADDYRVVVKRENEQGDLLFPSQQAAQQP